MNEREFKEIIDLLMGQASVLNSIGEFKGCGPREVLVTLEEWRGS